MSRCDESPTSSSLIARPKRYIDSNNFNESVGMRFSCEARMSLKSGNSWQKIRGGFADEELLKHDATSNWMEEMFMQSSIGSILRGTRTYARSWMAQSAPKTKQRCGLHCYASKLMLLVYNLMFSNYIYIIATCCGHHPTYSNLHPPTCCGHLPCFVFTMVCAGS